MHTDAGTAPRRSFLDRPVGKIALIVAVLVLAFGVSRSCGAVGDEVSQEEAIAIAKDAIGFEPQEVQIRLFKKGIKSHPYWGVSLYVGPRARPTQCRVVEVDAQNGTVARVARC